MLVCPGCLRPIDEILDNGCGSQRCPELVNITNKEYLDLLKEKSYNEQLIKGYINVSSKTGQWFNQR